MIVRDIAGGFHGLGIEYGTAIILLPCGKVRIISVDKCCRCLAAVRGKDRVADGISENRDIFIIQDVA